MEISSFYKNAPKITTVCYTIPKIWCVTDITLIFHLGLFCTFTHPPACPLTTQKIIIKKNEKKHLEISSFYTHIYMKNHDHMMHHSWDMVHNRETDGTARWTEKVTCKGRCPTKKWWCLKLFLVTKLFFHINLAKTNKFLH